LPLGSQMLVIHERIGSWARQIRGRVHVGGIRVVETRSATDLKKALAGAAYPLVVIDLGRRPRASLEDLDRAMRVAPDALVLVLDPESYEGAALLARELGAAHVMSGPVTPPAVACLLNRWLPLALRRAEAAGWSASAPEPAEPEPWNWLTPLLNGTAEAPRTTRD
jgi:DNA-binding NtrC family response regulator